MSLSEQQQRPQAVEPAPGSLEWARWYLEQHDGEAHVTHDNGNAIYAADYLLAAAILYDLLPAEFEGLARKLKNRGYNQVNFIRKTRETYYQRKEEAKSNPSGLTAGQAASMRGSGQALDLTDPEPADQPVDGSLLLQDLADTIRRFVRLSNEAVRAIVLWIIFTYLIDSFDYAPRLAICSPEMRCGKSTLVEVISHLVRRSLPCSNISPSAVYRTIEAVHPTLLMDEMDSYLRTDNEAGEEMRGILNSGHSRALAFIIRLVPIGQGDFEARKFSTFTPIVQSLIGRLPPTLADRSIAIAMQRKLPTEKVERLGGKNKQVNTALFEKLRRRIARWCADNRNQIVQSVPLVPESLDDRQQNNWGVLLSIADTINAAWGELARLAASQLSGTTDEVGNGVLLLRDLKEMFKSTDALWSANICEKLREMEQRPWPEYGRNRKPISQPQLAKLLNPFGVYPVDVRIDDKVLKGYRLGAALKDAFNRYCPGNSDFSSNSATTAGGVGESDDFASATTNECSGSQNGTNPNAENECSGIAAENPKNEVPPKE